MTAQDGAYNGDTSAPEDVDPPPTLFDPWETPKPPEWPSGTLPWQLENTLAEMALRDGVDFTAQCVAYLAAASGATHKGARFRPYSNATWTVRPVLWAMVVAASGYRKTAILQNAFNVITEADAEAWRHYRRETEDYDRLTAAERKQRPQPEEPPSIAVMDTSIEKLQRIMGNSRRGLLWVRDELAALFDFSRYSSGNGGKADGAASRAFLLEAYEGETYTVQRQNKPAVLIDPNALTIFGGIQPARIDNLGELSSDGLMQRFITVVVQPPPNSNSTVTVNGKEALDARIRALLTISAHDYVTTEEGTSLIRLTEKEGREFSTIPDWGQGFQGFCRKLHGTHARLSLVLHLLDDPEAQIIPTETVERARKLVMCLLCHARAFYDRIPGQGMNIIRSIAGWLLVNNRKRLLASDLTTNVAACRGMKTREINDALDLLITGGWLEPETPFPTNRAWRITPNLATAFAERAAAERESRAHVRCLMGTLKRGS